MHHQKDLSLRRSPLLTNSVHDRLQAAKLTRVMKNIDDKTKTRMHLTTLCNF